MNKVKILLILFVLISGFSFVNDAKAQPGISVDVDFNTFYNGLSPYGRWIEHGQYGRVWVYNEPGFRPYYTNGHWDYTDYGWTWVSDYDWGWGPFHYGRWEEDPELGWIWIPGYDWAPAWVSWSQADDYYGWAPLGYGLDLSVSFGRIPYDRWCFLPRAYITSPRFYDYCVPFNRNQYFYRNSIVINNIYEGGGRRYFMGPRREEVERYTHERIQPRRIDGDERFGFVQRGYRNDGIYRRDNAQRGDFRNQTARNANGGSEWQQNRNDSRQRIFGDRPGAQPNGQTGNNGYQPRIQRNPEIRPQTQPNAPIQQQRQYNGGGYNQPRVEQRPYSGNVGGDQRNMDRTESRQRVFGNPGGNGGGRQQSGGVSRQQNTSRGSERSSGGGDRGSRKRD